ncbi:MAG: hypothetical protein JW915_00830 [Chitinispirillaceae bacterium]|nr:hypothetical protein [Chitinispirillaceae bacterium]
MQIINALLLITQLMLVFLSCGLEPVSDGGGSGTETVNALACLSDGTPARGALVQVIDANGWLDSIKSGSSVVVQQTVADSQGHIKFSLQDKSKSYNIQIDHNQEGSLVRSITTESIKDDTFRLNTYSMYSGKFEGQNDSIKELLLSGSNYRAAVLSNGFIFSKVAPEAYTVIGKTFNQVSLEIGICGGITLKPGKTTIDTTLSGSINHLLIDDFENGVNTTAIGKLIPNLSWYAVSDNGSCFYNKIIDKIETTQGTNSQSYVSIAAVPIDNGGTAMQFAAVLDKANAPYAVAGVSMTGINPAGVDISAMTGFSFRAKGKGIVWVRFETQNLISATKGLSNYTYLLSLTDTLRDYRISVDSLHIVPNIQSPDQYIWANDARNLIDIEFEFSTQTNTRGDTLRFIIDDFYLENIGLNALK